MNLHIGIAKYTRKESKYKILPMIKADQEEIEQSFPQLSQFDLVIRKWGFSCMSLDCNLFIDVTKANVFSSMFDIQHSDLFENQFKPFVEALIQSHD